MNRTPLFWVLRQATKPLPVYPAWLVRRQASPSSCAASAWRVLGPAVSAAVEASSVAATAGVICPAGAAVTRAPNRSRASRIEAVSFADADRVAVAISPSSRLDSAGSMLRRSAASRTFLAMESIPRGGPSRTLSRSSIAVRAVTVTSVSG